MYLSFIFIIFRKLKFVLVITVKPFEISYVLKLWKEKIIGDYNKKRSNR